MARLSLMEVIEGYDFDQREYITQLEEQVAKLKKENDKMLTNGLATAQANSRSLLQDILHGVYDNVSPTDSQEKLFSRLAKCLKDFEDTCGYVVKLNIEIRKDISHTFVPYVWRDGNIELR